MTDPTTPPDAARSADEFHGSEDVLAPPPGLLRALYGDPHDRAVAKLQLAFFGCLQDDTEPIWAAEEAALRAEVEQEQAAAELRWRAGAAVPKLGTRSAEEEE